MAAPKRRVYPHVGQVTEWPTQQSLHLLWDRVFDLEERVTAQNRDLESANATITQLQAQLEDINATAEQALMQSGEPTPPAEEGFVDDGLGAAGCATHDGDGHPATGLPLDATTAGMIVCGTGAEFSALLAATGDMATRETNGETLIQRMIWHLAQYGFTAGRQQNPSLAISKDKLTFQVPGEPLYRAYDVFVGFHDFATPMTTHMEQVGPAHYVADAGVAD